ncbi:MAG: hypothetical protein KatS3mg060_3695 [Dehalococcoidia bacterium]|nr:MAG: hypothetical protein KatS3mg060_3695 [Dehalococcoidia bacterium]
MSLLADVRQPDTRSALPFSNVAKRVLASEWFFVTAGYFAIAVFVTYPLALVLDSFTAYGDSMLVTWALDWYAEAFPGRIDSLVTGPIFHPYPFTMFFDELFIAQAIQSWPLIKLTGNPILAYNVAILATFVLSALGVYLIIRRWTNNRAAAFVAGVLFAFGGIRMSHASHLHILSVQCAVFTIFFLDRWLVGRRWRDCAGLVTSAVLQTLSAYNFALIFPFAVGVWGVTRVACAPRLVTARTVLGLTITVVAVVVVNAPIALIYFRLSEVFQFSRDVAETLLYSATPLDYFVASPFNWLYGALTSTWRHPAWSEHSLFPGAVTLAFALVGVLSLLHPVSRGKRGLIAAALTMTIAMWNFSLGLAPLPAPAPDVRVYGWIYDTIGVARGIRVPARAALFVGLGLSFLAGFGLAWLLPRLSRWQAIRAAGVRLGLSGATVLALLFSGIAVTESVALPFIRQDQSVIFDGPPPVYRWLAVQPGRAPIVELPMLLHTREQWYETYRMLNGTYHSRPMINGYRGFTPANLRVLSQRMAAFPDDDTLAILHGLGVEFAIVHGDEMPPAGFEALIRRALARGMTPVASFENVLVYRVPAVPVSNPSKAAIELEAPKEVLPGGQAEAWVILSNGDYAPFVPRIAEPYRVRARWVADGRTIAEQSVSVQQPILVPAGDVVELPVPIDAPRWNGPVRLILEAQGELAGSGLRIEQDYLLTLR